MDNNLGSNTSASYVLLNICSGVFAFISVAGVQELISITAGVMAIIAALLAARYHWFAAKEKKQQIKKLNNGED